MPKIVPIRRAYKRCRWQYWFIFIRLAVVASEICDIPRNSLKIHTYRVQGHPKSSILVPIESALCTFLLATNSNFGRITVFEILTQLENSLFSNFSHPSRRNAMRYQRNLYTAEKCIQYGYNSVADVIGLSSFV